MKNDYVQRKTFNDVMVPNYNPQDIVPVKGQGIKIWDQEGKEYIDFSSGIAVNALGHCNPKLVKVIKDQSEKLWHLSNVFTNEPALKLAKELINRTFAEKIFFCNSGTEANEAAFKLARKFSFDNFSAEKNEIISFNNAFHGRSLFTVSVGGKKEYLKGFEPAPQGIKHLPFNDLKALQKHVSKKTCAIVLEPIQGEGGVIPIKDEFIKEIRALCDKHQALMIADEIQTGIGRTGKLYAYMHHEITPDIVTSAKGLGGGFPIGAMLTTTKIAKSLGVGTHGSTYGGNPLACAVSLEVLNLIDEDLLQQVNNSSKALIAALNQINKKYPIFEQIRGKGLLLGCKLKKEWEGQARVFLKKGITNGIMILAAGPSTLRLAPALNITKNEIKEGVYRLEQTVKQIYITNT